MDTTGCNTCGGYCPTCGGEAAQDSPEAQALCFLAGANSIFCGDKLLTTENPAFEDDMRLFERLGIRATHAEEHQGSPSESDAHALLR